MGDKKQRAADFIPENPHHKNGHISLKAVQDLARQPGNKRLIGIIIVVLILIAVGVVAGFSYKTKQDAQQAAAAVTCQKKDIIEAGQNLEPSSVDELKYILRRITFNPNYVKNPNCLYPVVIYYANSYDGLEAAKSFAALQKVYDPKVGFSRDLGSGVYRIETLKVIVDGLQPKNKNYKDSIEYAQ